MLTINPTNPRQIVNHIIKSTFGDQPISVLEAGGGSSSRLKQFGRVTINSITTVDIDAEQLARNTYADEKILADLQDFHSERKFDLIEVINVLEHIDDLGSALANLAACSAPGGLVVIGGPYLRSLFGIITKRTPHWVHVFHHKRLLGAPNAGKPGYAPFPTFYNPLMAPEALRDFFESRGFVNELCTVYDTGVFGRIGARSRAAYVPIWLTTSAINVVTPKRYDARNGAIYVVFRNTTA
jgi:SAM-dependent methyltransferase